MMPGSATPSALRGSLRAMMGAPIERVLMVDDEPHVRRVAELSLARVGKWSVFLAASGAEALSAAERERPDLILLDVMMPGMDGPTTLSALQAHAVVARIPVIFMTANVQDRQIERYLGLGAAGVIRKPFDPMLLPDQIRRIMAGECQTA
jgi:two-component system OmpR family response regulator